MLQAQLFGMSKPVARERVASLLTALQLDSFADRPAKTYSGGQRRRVLLAQARLGEPAFLVLDEPTTGLDPAQRARLRDILGRAGQAATVLISTSGSGQMQPLPMNEAIKQGLSEVGFNIRFEVLEWETLRGRRRSGAKAPENANMHALNNSLGSAEPSSLIDAVWSQRSPPIGLNWGWYNDPKMDDIASRAEVEFDPEKQDTLLAELHNGFVDNALWAFIVHDRNPRAMTKKVKGFTSAQSWFQDFTSVDME